MPPLRLTMLPLLLLGLGLPLVSQTVRYRKERPQQAATPFDFEEASSLMGIGETTLTGQASVVFKKSRFSFRKGTKIYPRDEAVFLYPMTKSLRAWVERYSAQGLFYGKFSFQPELARVAARTITDAEGRFQFRGLKPGQYLLWVVIPYELEQTVAVETGKWETKTWSWNGIVTAAVREPVTRAETRALDLENHVIHVVNIPPGQTLVNLGEIRGENAQLK